MFDNYFNRIDQLIWDLSIKLLDRGNDIILDYGFWSRQSRDNARMKIENAGHRFRLYYVKCEEVIMKKRVLERTSEIPPGSLWINEQAIEEFKKRFEPFEDDEEYEVILTD
jgi:predicted kinase